MCCRCSRIFPTVQKTLIILTKSTSSSQNSHYLYKIHIIIIKFLLSSNPHYPHKILIILTKSTSSSQKTHYPHKIHIILTKLSLSKPNPNHPHKILIIFIKSTWASQYSHYPHKIHFILTKFSLSIQNPHNPYKILIVLIKSTLSSQNPHHPHNFILTKSTWSSQNSHYPHKIWHGNISLTALISIRLLSFEWTCTGSSLRQVCPVSMLGGTPTKFMHFKCVRIVTKCANYICRARFSVCPRVIYTKKITVTSQARF
jgi:hypothetical protein